MRLPVQLPTKYATLNLKIAKAVGLAMPISDRARVILEQFGIADVASQRRRNSQA
jgi:hypothetical protein